MGRGLGNNQYLAVALILIFLCLLFGVLCYLFLPVLPLEGTITWGESLTAVFSLIAAIAAFINLIASHHYAARLEEFKHHLGASFPALQESRSAALDYYRTLAKMEIRQLTKEDINKSEETMSQAEGSIYFLDPSYQDAWYLYWQEARTIAATFSEMNARDAQDEWRKTWARKMGSHLSSIAAYQV